MARGADGYVHSRVVGLVVDPVRIADGIVDDQELRRSEPVERTFGGRTGAGGAQRRANG